MTDWPAGIARVVLDEVDSTSAEALRRTPTQPTWILAHRQSAARGRRGRAWSTPSGNFAASLIWRPGDGPARMALRSFTASLALHDTLTALGVQGLALKWPNDVLLEGGKLAGILLECPEPGVLVLGVGINLLAAPRPEAVEPDALRPVSLMEATGLRVTPEAMLDALAPAFAAREAQPFDRTRADWLARAANLHAPVTVRTMAETMQGTFDDLDADGCLMLGTSAGPRRVAAGDVFFEGVATCS
ncbi:Bifunctional protein BirA [Jannaschia seosinensis]|uniref:biotin--[biotin carboxyl-carrier protein] ligase n=1 Tax=Jannaschia seosinensis TaxID=313367 RepID=A0A0M7BA61_9RHOB|nr:biotin--[acetyl-CoA-carboxylase] ligase [Jannaschia seosinensis]CUH32165.1 Bifunctional protein BirA [Jannaschia seosinensis]